MVLRHFYLQDKINYIGCVGIVSVADYSAEIMLQMIDEDTNYNMRDKGL